jgi:hypothetical protein
MLVCVATIRNTEGCRDAAYIQPLVKRLSLTWCMRYGVCWCRRLDMRHYAAEVQVKLNAREVYS